MKRAARPAVEPDEALLRAYLLGGIAERDRAKLDRRLLADDELFEAASALEWDLLADYAAGALSEAEAAVVERWLAASQGVRDRLELVKALAALGSALKHPPQDDRERLEELWDRSFAERFRDSTKMLVLATEALDVATRLAVETHGARAVADLQARAWAEVGNAHRVAEDFKSADEAFAQSRKWLAGGTGEPQLSFRVTMLEASLRRDQRRLQEGLALVEEALRLCAELGDESHTGKALVNKGLVLMYSGDLTGSLQCFQAALECIDEKAEPQLVAFARFNQVTAFVEADQPWEAERILLQSGLRQIFRDEPVVLLRIRWLEARVFAAAGKADRAERLFREVRNELVRRNLHVDAAVVGLELSDLLLAKGQSASITRIARESLATFQSNDLHPQAIEALSLLVDACRKRTVTREVLDQMHRSFEELSDKGHLRCGVLPARWTRRRREGSTR